MLSQNDLIFSNSTAERIKRSSNFSPKEVKYLMQLVSKRKDIIESKKTDRATSEEKIKAWMEIAEEFNAVFEDYRPFKVLKTKYENAKRTFKRKLPSSVSNLGLLQIMQGTENAVANEPLSDIDYDLPEDENSLLNSNASDVDIKPTRPLNEKELDVAAEQYVFETLLFGEGQTVSSTVHRKTISKPHKEEHEPIEEIKEPSIDIWEQVAHNKLRKIELETKVIEEEWTLKKQKLELEIENVRLENRFKEEKFKLELELLKQKIEKKEQTLD